MASLVHISRSFGTSIRAGWGSQAWIPLAVASGILVATYGCSPNFRHRSGPHASPYGGDFLQEWVGGYIVRAGDRSRLYDLHYAQELQHDPQLVGFEWDRRAYLPIVYPPFYYLFLSPLSGLSFQAATWFWAVAMCGCLIASAWLVSPAMRGQRGFLSEVAGQLAAPLPSSERAGRAQAGGRTATWRDTGRLHWLWMLPAALLYAPTVWSLVSSQKGTLCLLILTATFVLLDRRHPTWAGVVFGLLAFKPQLTLLIPLAMLFKRQWRFVFGGSLTGLVLVVLSGTSGWAVCSQYVEFSRSAADYINTLGYDASRAHCLDGFVVELTGGTATRSTRIVTLILSALVIGLVGWMLRGRLQPGSRRFSLQFSGLVIATVLLSPHLYTYDLTVLLLPMLLLGLFATSDPLLRRAATGGWLVLYAAPAISGVVVVWTGVQLTVLVMLGVLAWLALARQSPATPHDLERPVEFGDPSALEFDRPAF